MKNITIRNFRTQNKVPARKIADVLGLKTMAAYYKKESGCVGFSLEDAKKISEYFGKSIEEIFFIGENSCTEK